MKGTIKDLVSYTKQSSTKRIFYQRLSLSIHELDNKKQFKCVWVSSDLKDEKELVLYPNKNDTVKGLLEEAAKKISFAENSRRKLRLLKISNHKIVAVCKDDIPLDTLLKSNESITTAQGAQRLFASRRCRRRICNWRRMSSSYQWPISAKSCTTHSAYPS